MVGIAGSGKTTLARSKYAGHAHVSLDVIKKNRHQKHELIREYGSRRFAGGRLSGNRKAEYVLIEDALAAGKNVVVDDTNLTAEIRAVHVEHARMHGAEVRAVYFDNAGRGTGGTLQGPPEKCLIMWSSCSGPRSSRLKY